MNIVECYLKALQKAEENATNGGIKMDKARFIQLFNAEQVRLARYYLDKKNDDRIRAIQRLMVMSVPLSRKSSFTNHNAVSFSFPDDYMDFVNIHCLFSKDGCEASDFNLWETKEHDVNELYADVFNRPSFEYRDTFFTVGEDSVKVYVSDFAVDSVSLTYYRFPAKVDISGYIKPDGSSSTDIDPEMDDGFVERVLNMIEKQFGLNESEYTRYRFDSNNVISQL